ncbi:MAG: hypothetical protein CMI26_08460 [Opitutae bacterium]|nr:hypothetical protein [Opitutae bacterium]
MLMFSIYLVLRSHAQDESNTDLVREQYVNELKSELVQIKKDLQALQPNNERPAVAPALSPAIPEVSIRKVSPHPIVLKRTAAIIEVKDDLHLIRQGLLKLKAENATEPSKQIESNFPVRSIVKVRQRGDYFLFINSGVSFAGEREYGTSGLALRTRTGIDFSIAFGGQFGQWTIGPEIGYRRLGYKEAVFGAFSTPATGASTSRTLAIYGGRDFAMGNSLNIHAGVSIGLTYRDESFTLPSVSTTPTADDDLLFQGSFRMALEYAFSDLCEAHIGYRFTYLDELGEFDSMPINQVELGLRLNL